MGEGGGRGFVVRAFTRVKGYVKEETRDRGEEDVLGLDVSMAVLRASESLFMSMAPEDIFIWCCLCKDVCVKRLFLIWSLGGVSCLGDIFFESDEDEYA